MHCTRFSYLDIDLDSKLFNIKSVSSFFFFFLTSRHYFTFNIHFSLLQTSLLFQSHLPSPIFFLPSNQHNRVQPLACLANTYINHIKSKRRTISSQNTPALNAASHFRDSTCLNTQMQNKFPIGLVQLSKCFRFNPQCGPKGIHSG